MRTSESKYLAWEDRVYMSNKSDTDSANKDLFSKTHAVGRVEKKKADFPKGASIKLSHHRCHIAK